MIKSKFLKDLADETGFPISFIKETISAYDDWIRNEVVKNHKCQIPKLGTFYVLERKGRMGHNPANISQKAMQPDRLTPKFKFSNTVRDALNPEL